MNKGWSNGFVIALLLAVVGLSGCYEPEPRPRIVGQDRPVAMPARQTIPQYRLLGRSIQGRPITAQILGDGADTTFIMATIHGNEPAGTPLLEQLADHLATNPQTLEGRRVVLVTVANPDGMAAGTRENIRGIDLNRNFQTANRVDNATYGLQALSEPETQAIQRAIQEFHPDRIITIHQPLNCIDYDGPGHALATHIAQFCKLPVKKLGARPGSLGSYSGEELGIPTVTVEFPAAASQLSDAELWNRYGPAMTAAVTYSVPASK
jgi:protein MpaA